MFRQLSPSSDEDIMLEKAPVQYRASQRQTKGHLWLESEHDQFLAGLAKLGRGNWRDISRWFVPSRTPTQVASHAQKYFMRISGVTKKRSRFSSSSEAKAFPASVFPTSQLDSPSESNSPASTTVTTSSDATAAAATFDTPIAVPSCPPTAPCPAAAGVATSAPAAVASPPPPQPSGRQLGVPVFLPGPGGLPMVLTYPRGCCAPMVTPFSPWTFSMHMVAGPASKKPPGTAADLGIWPSPMMLHAMTTMQQQQQTMATAIEAAAAASASADQTPSPAPPSKRPRLPPYTLPAGVRKPALAQRCSAALLEAVLASVADKAAPTTPPLVMAACGSAFRPVTATVGLVA